MNGLRKRQSDRRRTRLKTEIQAERGSSASFWLCSLVLLITISGVALAYIRFNSEQVKLGRHLRDTRREFALRSKELENIRVEVESYKSAAYIRNAVRQMQLGLREPDQGQVRRVRDGRTIRNPDWTQDSMLASK